MTICKKIINDEASINFIVGETFDFIGLTDEKTFKDKLLEECQKFFDSVECFDAGAVYDENNPIQTKYRPNGESCVNFEAIVETLTLGENCVVVNIKSILGRGKEVFLASLSSLFNDNKLGNSKLIILANECDKNLINIKAGIRYFEVTPPTCLEIKAELKKLLYDFDEGKVDTLGSGLGGLYFRDIKKRIPNIVKSFQNGEIDSYIQNLNSNKNTSTKNITFKDVAGLESVKEKVKEKVIYPFTFRELYETFKKGTDGGILLYGPPGTGKTMIVKAIAAELDAELEHISFAVVGSKYHAETEQNIKLIFDKAKQRAEQGKNTVILFDDIDSFISTRNSGDSNDDKTVGELLIQMQELSSEKVFNSKILVVGTTNIPWSLDSALLRPGRFDDKIYVPLPDDKARLKIIEIELAGVPVDDDIDFEKLVELSSGFNCADVRYLCQMAKQQAINRIIDKKVGKKSISMQDFINAKVTSTVCDEEILRIEKWENEFKKKSREG